MSVTIQKMFYFTYVLRSDKDDKLYTGYTHRLQERLEEHNLGLNKSTKGRGPFRLIYFEACESKAKAIERERYLKSGHGKHFLRGRIGAPYF